MAKTYDIADSTQVNKLRNSTLGYVGPSTPSSKRSGAAHFGSSPANNYPVPTGEPAKPSLVDQIFAPGGPYDLSQPGTGETTIAQHLNDFFQPTNSQNLYNQGAFNTPTASENFYAQNASQYSTPGAAENWNASHSALFDQPGAAEDFYAQHKGDLANMPTPSNRAEEAYQHIKANMPDISADPGLDPYYRNAARVGTQNLNTQLAARGAYGSSVGVGQIGNLLSSLGAEKANREAQYNLDRLAEQRGWESTQGQLAQGADVSSGRIHDAKLSDLLDFGQLAQNAQSSSLARLLGGSASATNAQNAQTNRLNAGSSAAGQASSSDLQRQQIAQAGANQADTQNRSSLEGGIDAAVGGQNLRTGRIQGAFNNISGAGQTLINGIAQHNQDAQFNSDQMIFDAQKNATAAQIQNATNRADKAAARNTQMWATIFTAALALA